jgi:hypothetical protein
MKATEIMKLIELGQTFKTKPKRMRKKDFDLDEYSITMLLHKKLEEAEAMKKLLEDYHKAHKKDEKKEGWNIHHISMFFMLTFPIIGPLYAMWLKSLLH